LLAVNRIMRKVVVKYCGGCNPVLDRLRIIEEIESLLPSDYNWKIDSGGTTAEIGIAMCGCAAACVDKPEIKNLAKNWVVIAGKTVDLETLPEEKITMSVARKIIKLDK